MTKISEKIEVETAFDQYVLDEILGEGGAGRVYGGRSSEGEPIAIKVLSNSSSDKRKRFKNETNFLFHNKHSNIVTVRDFGFGVFGKHKAPFYVMDRFAGNLRSAMKSGFQPDQVMQIFNHVLNGVEAAHFVGAVHRDLKPENVLIDAKTGTAAIADFGVALFAEEQLATIVETGPSTRLANFQYAAPEQRTPGRIVTAAADIYALGLILNEMFTAQVPHGIDFVKIEAISGKYAYLDPVVSAMLKQNPSDRPDSVATVKALIQKHNYEAVSLQKIREYDRAVISAGEVSDPLALHPPKLIAARFDGNDLILTLDREVNNNWVEALHNMGSFTSVVGVEPARFRFKGAEARVGISGNSAQNVINYFKQWLPQATATLKFRMENEMRRREQEQRLLLAHQREREQKILLVNQGLKI